MWQQWWQLMRIYSFTLTKQVHMDCIIWSANQRQTWESGQNMVREGDSEKLRDLPMVNQGVKTAAVTTSDLSTQRKRTSQQPILLVKPPLFCSPSGPSFHLSCQDHGKTPQVCPSLTAHPVTTGIQTKIAVIHQDQISLGRSKEGTGSSGMTLEVSDSRSGSWGNEVSLWLTEWLWGD